MISKQPIIYKNYQEKLQRQNCVSLSQSKMIFFCIIISLYVLRQYLLAFCVFYLIKFCIFV